MIKFLVERNTYKDDKYPYKILDENKFHIYLPIAELNELDSSEESDNGDIEPLELDEAPEDDVKNTPSECEA